MARHKVTKRNLPKVLATFTQMLVATEGDERQAWCDSLNKFFDELVGEDAFGTEAQCDPRGDQRD